MARSEGLSCPAALETESPALAAAPKSSAALKTANDRVRKLRRLTLKCFGMPPPFRVIILSFPFRVGLGLFVAYRLATGYGPLVPFPVVGGVEDWDYRLGVVQEPCHQGVELPDLFGHLLGQVVLLADRPVMIAKRLGEHSGLAEYALVNIMPRLPSLSTLGVS
jgi:hypothetical protein